MRLFKKQESTSASIECEVFTREAGSNCYCPFLRGLDSEAIVEILASTGLEWLWRSFEPYEGPQEGTAPWADLQPLGSTQSSFAKALKTDAKEPWLGQNIEVLGFRWAGAMQPDDFDVARDVLGLDLGNPSQIKIYIGQIQDDARSLIFPAVEYQSWAEALFNKVGCSRIKRRDYSALRIPLKNFL
jgi:hypothetical protein